MDKSNSIIKTIARSYCVACKSNGTIVYENLTDKLFSTAGEWSMRKCNNKKCGTFWLDPSPQEEDLYKLYDTYTTHEDTVSLRREVGNKILNKIRNSYLYSKYGYGNEPSRLEKLLGLIAYIHPSWRDFQEANIFYLPAKKNGRLLDVGCGSGSTIQILEQKGWKGVGVDFDKKAIENAKKKNIEVYYGDLFSQSFADNSFDAIVMNHVIEHVPSPVLLLEECRRILKKGGTLVAITPNAGSRGHEHYKEDWRGLETPTHLQVFTVESLKNVATDAGFTSVKYFSSMQGILYILDASENMKRHKTFEIKINNSLIKKMIQQVRWLFLGILHTLQKNRDEVAVIVCTK